MTFHIRPTPDFPQTSLRFPADFQTLISCIQCDYHTHSYQPNFLQCICMPYPVTVAHDLMWYFVCSQQRWRQTTSRAGERLLTSIDGRWMDQAQFDSLYTRNHPIHLITTYPHVLEQSLEFITSKQASICPRYPRSWSLRPITAVPHFVPFLRLQLNLSEGQRTGRSAQ